MVPTCDKSTSNPSLLDHHHTIITSSCDSGVGSNFSSCDLNSMSTINTISSSGGNVFTSSYSETAAQLTSVENSLSPLESYADGQSSFDSQVNLSHFNLSDNEIAASHGHMFETSFSSERNNSMPEGNSIRLAHLSAPRQCKRKYFSPCTCSAMNKQQRFSQSLPPNFRYIRNNYGDWICKNLPDTDLVVFKEIMTF